ncbi:MAG: hypothetical protein ACRD50_10190 [Candidatus Acidiferrales bacterium]
MKYAKELVPTLHEDFVKEIDKIIETAGHRPLRALIANDLLHRKCCDAARRFGIDPLALYAGGHLPDRRQDTDTKGYRT